MSPVHKPGVITNLTREVRHRIDGHRTRRRHRVFPAASESMEHHVSEMRGVENKLLQPSDQRGISAAHSSAARRAKADTSIIRA